jgi:hypothetical protein
MRAALRVQLSPGSATGTVERVREDQVVEVVWDTGARCAVPGDWLLELEQGSRLEITCGRCGEAFAAQRRSARYCSNACRQRAKRKRQSARHAKRGPTGEHRKGRGRRRGAYTRAQMSILDQALRNPMLGAAIENARNGLPVYAATPKGKAPLHKGWLRSATTKIERLERVWAQKPNANVGIACRELVVLDADSKRGEDAVADLGLPPTTTVRTARGSHFYFAGRHATVARILPDAEVRGEGSGVLGAGAVHPSGRDYEWEIPPWEVPPAPVPDELRELIERKRPTAEPPANGIVREGGRSIHLLRIAGSLKGRYGLSELAPVLHPVNETMCSPPLPRAKVEKLVRDASKWPRPPLWVADPQTFSCCDPRLSLKARIVLWLLCGHADANGDCFPSLRRLSELSGIGRPNTVSDALRELEAAERIVVMLRSRRGNRYRLLPWRPLERLTTKGGRSSVTPRRYTKGRSARG